MISTIRMMDRWEGKNYFPIPHIFCHNPQMRKLTATICLTIALLLGSAVEGWSSTVEPSKTNLVCKTEGGMVVNEDYSSKRIIPKSEIFVTIKIENLDKPVKTKMLVNPIVTQTATISVDGPTYYYTPPMKSFIGIVGKKMTIINEKEYSFTNSESELLKGRLWNISINRFTGFMEVLGSNTCQGCAMTTYSATCQKAKRRKF
jgi:hypothetical protein